jgi:hypothetical protein
MDIYFVYISIFSALVPLITYLLRLRITMPVYIHYLFCLVVVSFLFDAINLYLVTKGFNPNVLTNIYFVVLFIALSRIYFLFWLDIYNIRKGVFRKLSCLFVALFVFNTTYESLNKYNL